MTANGGSDATPRRRRRLRAARGIPRRTSDGPAPLTFAQERIWFLEQMAGGQPLFGCPFAVWLDGDLDVAAWERSLHALEERHEALRTTFDDPGTGLVQNVSEPRREPLALVDLTDLPEGEREAAALARLNQDAVAPFDLETGPVWRYQLIRTGPRRHLAYVSVHHVVFDVGSTGLLFAELAAKYGEFAGGPVAELPELPVRLVDYAEWERGALEGAKKERALAYWKEKLGGTIPSLELPCDRPRPPVQTYRGGYAHTSIPADLSAKLKALSQAEGVTMFMLMLAAYKVLLHRYAGQTDVLVGIPFSIRSRSELEGMLGMLINTVVLRTDLGGDPSFRDVAGRMRDTALDAFTHHDLPFEVLVAELHPDRDLSRYPLFQVMFDMLAGARHEYAVPGLERATFVEPWDLHTESAKTDLHLYVWEEAEGMTAAVEYNADLFDAVTVERLLGHYVTLLQGIVADPDTAISQLKLLGDEEAATLRAWGRPVADYPRAATITELFEARAAECPDAIAIRFGETRTTYGDLNAQANRLAHRLRELGVGNEVRVGICAERRPELIVGILAILKAGGAYVPLDVDYPAERLQFLMRDAGAPVLLVQDDLVDRLPEHGAQVVSLSPGDHAGQPDSNPEPVATAESLAYVMYTSGSTGTPKGVCVVHRNVVRLVQNTNFAAMGPDEVFLHFAPISFDASTLEVWGPLLNGGTMVVYPPAKPSVEDLGAAVRDGGVTTMWLTAGLFRLMVDERLEDLRGVRQLLAGGDVLSVPHVARVLDELPDTTVINGYGPTENTTFTCCCPMTSSAELGATVPIGRPIANTTVYVLDEHRMPVPIGVAGELWTGGDGVARGYLDREELTAERFVDDPFVPGGRMYRTGDVVRWLPDGRIEFLGRRDNQVKLRGFRIELGEIETRLGSHPEVKTNVVIAREDTPGDKRLVAYVVPNDGAEPDGQALRRWVEETLPGYMVPAVVQILPSLPLTPNGKVDRDALPAPEQERPSEKAFVSPRSALERTIAGTWQAVLSLEQVGAEDNFFDLGGHSLQLAQVCTRLKRELDRDIPMAVLFQHPTVGSLAEFLGEAEGETAKPAVTGAERRQKAASKRAAADDLFAAKRRRRGR